MHDIGWMMIVIHYVKESGAEWFVEIGDHFISHYVMIIVIKVGAAHVVAIVAHRVVKVAKSIKGTENVE